MTQFIDISSYNNSVDWTTYSAWSSMVAIKSSEGVGFVDSSLASHRAGALAAGINSVWYYHFSRPDTGNDPIAEANWQHFVVGAIRPQDRVVLDFEVSDPRATADWAYRFLAQQEANYGGQLPVIYASTSYILRALQDPRLTKYPLWLADWTHDPTIRPLCPLPWTSYTAIQYTDQAIGIPGIAEAVDADVFLEGGAMIVPTGWPYDPNTGILTAPGGGHTVRLGNAKFVLMWPGGWPPGNIPVEEEHGAPGGGTEQTFENCKIGWNSKDGVHIAPLGTQYLIAQAQITALKAQLAALNTIAINTAITQANAMLAQLSSQVAADITTIQTAIKAITPPSS
jgi:GH25 family lysozyme M1 (1,4-beta-N-acetylmuramidase)